MHATASPGWLPRAPCSRQAASPPLHHAWHRESAASLTRLSLGESSMARLLVACQVIRYGFFIVRKSFSSFVLNFVIPPRLLWPFTYIYDSSVCDARCTHPASLMVLPSDPPFRIDLPILCESAGAALSTLAPGLQHMTVVRSMALSQGGCPQMHSGLRQHVP